MEQKTYTYKADAFRNELISQIREKIETDGTQSKINSDVSLFLNPGFDSDSIGHTIKEAQFNQLIDERGLYYDYNCLTIDELAELADLLKA